MIYVFLAPVRRLSPAIVEQILLLYSVSEKKTFWPVLFQVQPVFLCLKTVYFSIAIFTYWVEKLFGIKKNCQNRTGSHRCVKIERAHCRAKLEIGSETNIQNSQCLLTIFCCLINGSSYQKSAF